MKKILSLARSARRHLVMEGGYEHSIARDLFFSRLTARLLGRRGIISESAERSSEACAHVMTRELGDAPGYVLRAALHERSTISLDEYVCGALDTDPLMMGWAYQFWNDTERDRATTAISRRGDARTDHGQIPVATQLFTEEYMASFLIERYLTARECRSPTPEEQIDEVLDPACGVGHMLVPLLRASRARARSRVELERSSLDALSRLYGCDIDETAVELCRILLLAEACATHEIDPKAAWSVVRDNIQRLDSPWGTLDRRQATPILQKTYAYVLTNPPYIGRRKLCEETRDFLDTNYPATSMDLCVAFIERCIELTQAGGIIGLVTVDKWLRLKPYEALRTGGDGFPGVYRALSLDVMCELGHRAFSSTSSLHDGVGVCLVSATKEPPSAEHSFLFISAADKRSMAEKIRSLTMWSSEPGARVRQVELVQDGGSTAFIARHGLPTALTASRRTAHDIARVVVGLQTSDDRRFVRYVWSVPPDRSRWIVHSKGGGYDRWFGLNRYVLDWGEGRQRFEDDPKSGIAVRTWFAEEGWTYTWFANGALGLRWKEAGWSFGRAASSGVFCDDPRCVAFLNSRMASLLVRRLGGKPQLPEGVVRSLPIPESFDEIDPRLVDAAVLLKRALVEHDPTDATFSPVRVWDPREQLCLQALLLVVEGVLERQVCDSLRLTPAEQTDLEERMGAPVAWIGRRSSFSDDEVWRFIPDTFQFLRPLLEPARRAIERRSMTAGGRNHHVDSPGSKCHPGRPLPSTSLVESISRETGIHPCDVALDSIGALGVDDAVTARLIAPALRDRIVTLALTELGHTWWREGMSSGALEFPELSVEELASRVEGALRAAVRIPESQRDALIGGSLERWMVSNLERAQLRLFARTPLFEWRAGRLGGSRYLRHVWSVGIPTSACDRRESLERHSP